MSEPTTEPAPVFAVRGEALSLLRQWAEKKGELSAIKTAELALRQKIVGLFFPGIGAGTSRVVASNATVKAVVQSSMKIDKEALQNLWAKLPPEFRQEGILVEWSPVPVAAGIKSLRETAPDVYAVFSACLTIGENSPSLEVDLPQDAQLEMDLPPAPVGNMDFSKSAQSFGALPEGVSQTPKVCEPVKLPAKTKPKKPAQTKTAKPAPKAKAPAKVAPVKGKKGKK